MADSTAAAAPPPFGEVSSIQNPRTGLHTLSIATTITIFCLITPVYSIRMYVRGILVRSFGAEDYMCTAAYITLLCYWIASIFMHHYGIGYHLWDVTQKDFRMFQIYSFVGSILYSWTSFTTKVALNLLSVRIFSPFRKLVVFTRTAIIIQAAFFIAITVVKTCLCIPIAASWDGVEAHPGARCINRHASFVADTAFAAVADMAILLPPVILTWSLSFSMMKKIRIMFMLGAGGLATATNFVRLWLLLQPGSFVDITFNFAKFNLLGLSEIGIGLICACLPALHILFRQFKPEDSPIRQYVFDSVLRNPRRTAAILLTASEEGRETQIIQASSSGVQDSLGGNVIETEKIELPVAETKLRQVGVLHLPRPGR